MFCKVLEFSFFENLLDVLNVCLPLRDDSQLMIF